MKTEHLLQEAVEEIRQLRRQNDTLRGKMEVFDTMRALLFTSPHHGGAMSPDICWMIEQHLSDAKRSQVPTPEPLPDSGANTDYPEQVST